MKRKKNDKSVFQRPSFPMSITFVPFSTFVDPSLWSEVNRRKINVWQLDDSVKSAQGTFSIYGKQIAECSLTLSHDAFTDDEEPTAVSGITHISGEFHLTNTINDFLTLDRKSILNDCAQRLWQLITSQKWLTDPNLLNTFHFTAFAVCLLTYQ
jgi:hypothetical protein